MVSGKICKRFYSKYDETRRTIFNMMPKDETKDEAKRKVEELAGRFRYNLDVYKKIGIQ